MKLEPDNSPSSRLSSGGALGRRRYAACITVTTTDAVAQGMLIAFLPFALLGLGVEAEVVTLLATVYGIGAWLGSPVLGLLGDRFERWHIIAACLFVSGGAYAAMLVHWSIAGIFLWRGVAGLLVGREALLRASIVDGQPPGAHPRIIGTLTGAGAIGAVLGALLVSLPTLLFGRGDHHLLIVGGAAIVHLASLIVTLILLRDNAAPPKTAVRSRPPKTGGSELFRMLYQPLIVQALISYGWGVILSTTAILVDKRFSWTEAETGMLVATVAIGTIVARLWLMPPFVAVMGLSRAAYLSIAFAAPSLVMIGLAPTPLIYGAAFIIFVVAANIVMTVPTLMITQSVPGSLYGTTLGWRQAVGAVMTFGTAGLNGLLFAEVAPAAPYVVGGLAIACSLFWCRLPDRAEAIQKRKARLVSDDTK